MVMAVCTGQPQNGSRSGDIVSVAQLLEASGVDLDEDLTKQNINEASAGNPSYQEPAQEH